MPGILAFMAKVMVSMPDELLTRVDRAAEQRGTTRSGYLRSLAEADLAAASRHRAERIAQIQKDVPEVGRGGDAAQLVKQHPPGW